MVFCMVLVWFHVLLCGFDIVLVVLNGKDECPSHELFFDLLITCQVRFVDCSGAASKH